MPGALQSLTAATQTSARFYIPEEKSYLSALLDYMMVSSDLRAKRGQWGIWHPTISPLWSILTFNLARSEKICALGVEGTGFAPHILG